MFVCFSNPEITAYHHLHKVISILIDDSTCTLDFGGGNLRSFDYKYSDEGKRALAVVKQFINSPTQEQ